uniref:Uncharacterized protein n=1 Tax=Biomphalaria glabrata TaxID=6526 RepID=A0A2C9KHK1_BIOGL
MKALRIDKKLAQMSEMNALPLPTTTTWSVEEFLNNTKEVTKEVGNELSALNRVLAENVYELINLFIGHVAHEYNDLETIYAAEQKIVENDILNIDGSCGVFDLPSSSSPGGRWGNALQILWVQEK